MSKETRIISVIRNKNTIMSCPQCSLLLKCIRKVNSAWKRIHGQPRLIPSVYLYTPDNHIRRIVVYVNNKSEILPTMHILSPHEARLKGVLYTLLETIVYFNGEQHELDLEPKAGIYDDDEIYIDCGVSTICVIKYPAETIDIYSQGCLIVTNETCFYGDMLGLLEKAVMVVSLVIAKEDDYYEVCE